MPATAVLAVGLLLASACGGTLEGRYRRGELTTTTTAATGGARSTGTTATTVATTSTTTKTLTSGNAAGQRAQGEPERLEAGGTIVERATRRAVAPPLGGRHR
jgi:hypothetical protein